MNEQEQKLGIVKHACNPSTQEATAGESQFKLSLTYIKEDKQAYNETLSQIRQKVLYSR